MITRRIPIAVVFLGILTACVSGQPSHDTYSSQDGTVTRIESDREQCTRSCNDTYTRCMETFAAQNSGVNGPSGMFGGSADCRNDLEACLPQCKAR